MGRQKKVSKPKEPVRIRQRKLKNGNISLYLDIYSDRHLFRWCQKIRVAVALPRSRERPDFKRPEQTRYASGKQGEVRKNIGVAEPWHQTMGENQAGEYATADLALQI